jgi:hypothetical protein
MQHPTAPPPSSRQVLHVLLIGNSCTYVNNLGDILAGIADADPEGPIIVPVLATRGGATLKWHLENGSTLKQVQAGGWSHVVLQEQSLLGGRSGFFDGQTVVGDPKEFFNSTRDWVHEIRQVGATPILFMTWAHRSPWPQEMINVQTQLADAFDTIGSELRVTVAPVGLAWRETARRLRTLELHIFDGNHPAPAGSYLAALVVYSTLTGRNPSGAPAVINGRPAIEMSDGQINVDSTLRVPLVDLREATAAQLQEIAWTVVSSRSPQRGKASELRLTEGSRLTT